MKRRDLLKTQFVLPAAGFPAAGFEAFALGQSAALPPTGGIHPVEAGQAGLGRRTRWDTARFCLRRYHARPMAAYS